MPVGSRNGLDHDSVVSCDSITTVPAAAAGHTIGLLLDDQGPELARATGDAFDLFIPWRRLVSHTDPRPEHTRGLGCLSG